METVRRRGRQVKGSLYYIPIGDISPNPAQPRKRFSDEGLSELRDSIQEHGVLQPLTVRMQKGGYELIAGERRLRAAKMAGLSEVPCLVLNVDMEESSLMALVENLQRRDLDIIEQAEGIAQLIRVFGMSQEEAARRLGKSQPAIANKLRLLKLPPDVLESLRDKGLSERHGRALLKLPDGTSQRAVLEHICEAGLNVAATERYIDELLAMPDIPYKNHAPQAEEFSEADSQDKDKASNKGGRKTRFVLKDVRIFLNTISRYVEIMRNGGIDVTMLQQQTEDKLVVTITIGR